MQPPPFDEKTEAQRGAEPGQNLHSLLPGELEWERLVSYLPGPTPCLPPDRLWAAQGLAGGTQRGGVSYCISSLNTSGALIRSNYL